MVHIAARATDGLHVRLTKCPKVGPTSDGQDNQNIPKPSRWRCWWRNMLEGLDRYLDRNWRIPHEPRGSDDDFAELELEFVQDLGYWT